MQSTNTVQREIQKPLKGNSRRNWSDLEKTNVKNKSNWDDLRVCKLGKMKTPYVTISENKTIRFSRSFLNQADNQIRGMKNIAIYFSKKNKAIVFEFLSEGNDINSSEFKATPVSFLSAAYLFDDNSLDAKEFRGRQTAKYENIPGVGGRWVVYLKKQEN